jgi:hypothetical protein
MQRVYELLRSWWLEGFGREDDGEDEGEAKN